MGQVSEAWIGAALVRKFLVDWGELPPTRQLGWSGED